MSRVRVQAQEEAPTKTSLSQRDRAFKRLVSRSPMARRSEGGGGLKEQREEEAEQRNAHSKGAPLSLKSTEGNLSHQNRESGEGIGKKCRIQTMQGDPLRV